MNAYAFVDVDIEIFLQFVHPKISTVFESNLLTLEKGREECGNLVYVKILIIPVSFLTMVLQMLLISLSFEPILSMSSLHKRYM